MLVTVAILYTLGIPLVLAANYPREDLKQLQDNLCAILETSLVSRYIDADTDMKDSAEDDDIVQVNPKIPSPAARRDSSHEYAAEIVNGVNAIVYMYKEIRRDDESAQTNGFMVMLKTELETLARYLGINFEELYQEEDLPHIIAGSICIIERLIRKP